jgi:DNA-binding transcriptional regulator YiaG
MSHSVTCPSCGGATATARALASYRYRESGIPNLWLEGGVTETVCASCRKRHIRIEKESQLLQVIALRLLMDARPLTGYELRFLRGACSLSQAKLAEALRRRRETVAEREAKAEPGIPFAEEVLIRFVLLGHFNEHLRDRENSFLTKRQRGLLADFTKFLSVFSRDFADETLKRHRLVATLDKRRALWELAEAA